VKRAGEKEMCRSSTCPPEGVFYLLISFENNVILEKELIRGLYRKVLE